MLLTGQNAVHLVMQEGVLRQDDDYLVADGLINQDGKGCVRGRIVVQYSRPQGDSVLDLYINLHNQLCLSALRIESKRFNSKFRCM